MTGDDIQTQVIINCGVLNSLLALLNSPKETIRKEACWTISNITAGNAAQIKSVLDANLIAPLIDILSRGDFKTKREACWAISNATAGSVTQSPDIIRFVVVCFLSLLDSSSTKGALSPSVIFSHLVTRE